VQAVDTIRKTITLTRKQDAWIKAQIERGDFTNDSEYIRDLVRRDQDRWARFEALKRAIEEGLDSGVSGQAVADIWSEAESREANSTRG
jgi:antitoxin ParD1/3/4